MRQWGGVGRKDLAIPTIKAPDFLIESLQYGHFRIDTAILT